MSGTSGSGTSGTKSATDLDALRARLAAVERIKARALELAAELRADFLRAELREAQPLFPDDATPSVLRELVEKLDAGKGATAALVSAVNKARRAIDLAEAPPPPTFACALCHGSWLAVPSILRRLPDGRAVCADCEALATGSDLIHGSMVRCPRCHHVETPECVGHDKCGPFAKDGVHGVTCGECSHDYQIVTHVSIEFESPASVAEGPAS